MGRAALVDGVRRDFGPMGATLTGYLADLQPLRSGDPALDLACADVEVAWERLRQVVRTLRDR